MIELTAENYNKTIRSGNSILIFLEDPSDAKCIIALDTLKRIDGMQGKEFIIGLVNVNEQTEISNVLTQTEIPSFVFIRDKKVAGILKGMPTENEILELTRK